jgi:hypothetical protein
VVEGEGGIKDDSQVMWSQSLIEMRKTERGMSFRER